MPKKRAVPRGKGTIGETVDRLASWCRRASHGFARAEFVSEPARQRVMDQLAKALHEHGITIYSEITLPTGLTPMQLSQELLCQLDQLSGAEEGVVSITGFATAFPSDASLEQSLKVFNFYRESLNRPGLRQIWWMPTAFAERFVRAVPDLDSWFLARVRLMESIPVPTTMQAFEFAEEKNLSPHIEDARNRAQNLAKRFQFIVETSKTTEEVIAAIDLARDATKALLDVPARTEARRLSIQFLDLLEQHFPPVHYTIKDSLARKVLDYISHRSGKVPKEAMVFVDTLIDLYTLKGNSAEEIDLLNVTLHHFVREKAASYEGTLPPHNLPLDRLGDLFKGREDALVSLHTSLSQKKTTIVVQKQAIHGLGGIGKTRLAIEYAYRYAREYTALLFVRADSSVALNTNLAALADLLNLLEHEAREEPVKTAAVLHWLETNPGWLLILDNVDSKDAIAAVQSILPRLNIGCVLITTRRAQWPLSVKRHGLDTLTIEDAAAYLLESTDLDRAKSPDDPKRAEELAQKLDGLPLALELAAAYIASRHWSFDRYLHLWETERESILEWHDKHQTEYPFSLAFAWQASFDQLTLSSRALLNICAFLAPDPIPEFLFEGQQERLQQSLVLLQGTGKKKKKPPHQTTFNVSEALADLFAYSLITSEENNAFSIHRLVQEVVRSCLPIDSHHDWIKIALVLVDAVTPYDTEDVRSWPVMNQLHPHAMTITDQADIIRIPEPTARIMNQFGWYLKTKALFLEAEPLMRRALRINENSLGYEHHIVAICLNNLAQLLSDTNRLAEAEPLMRRALEIDEKSFGPDHPEVAIRLNNLAYLLKETNRLAEAKSLMQRALEIDEKSFGPDHPKIALRLNNLALLLRVTNRLTQAEPLMRRVLEIDEKSFGPDHPNVARDLNNLAQLLKTTNRLGEAEPLMKRALEIDEKSFGPDHPNVAICLNNLAQLLHDTNRLAEAEPLMQRALDIEEKSFGPDHPNVAICLNNLAQFFHDTNRLAQAEPLMRRALEIDEKSFGLDHPKVATRLNNLAQFLKATNRLTEAEPLMKRALAIFEVSLGPDHPKTCAARENLELLEAEIAQSCGKKKLKS